MQAATGGIRKAGKIGFFVSYCVFLLIYGPLADRFGRRLPLLTGIGIFILASLLCAFSNSITSLIVLRVFQAAGAASSLLIFIYFILGAFAMWLISLDWPDKIHTIGLLGTASGGVMLGLWFFLARKVILR